MILCIVDLWFIELGRVAQFQSWELITRTSDPVPKCIRSSVVSFNFFGLPILIAEKPKRDRAQVIGEASESARAKSDSPGAN